MTVLPQKGAPPQPLSKAPSTVQSSSLEAIANNGKNESGPKVQSKTRSPKARHDTPPADFTSTSATLSLIRRVLISEKPAGLDSQTSPEPIDDILPPLTSSNDVDVQLYAIVAIVIKDFVNTWYANITPDDQFVDEVIHIIAHCSRALEQRIRHTDLVELLLDELPALIERHVVAYRTAVTTSMEFTYSTKVHQIYHTLKPHPALEPLPSEADSETLSEQNRNEAIYRQLLIHGALAVLLPTEDLQNTPLRLLVGDIIADLIIGQALAGKICEGWFIHDTITKVITIIKERVEPKASGQELREDTKTRLERFGLLNSEVAKEEPHSSSGDQSVVLSWFWQIMQGGFLVFLILRFLVKGTIQARAIPSRSKHLHPVSLSPTMSKLPGEEQRAGESPRPILCHSVYGTIANLLRFHHHMPWLASFLMFWQHVLVSGVGRFGATNSVLDRFLHNTIQTYIFPATIIPSVLLNLRVTLFPNNSMGPAAPPPPSAEQRLAIRRKAAESVLSLLPPMISRVYFATSDGDEMLDQIEEDILNPFGDVYLNKHLVYSILELIVCKLIPELTEKSTSELLAERGVTLGSEKNGDDEEETLLSP